MRALYDSICIFHSDLFSEGLAEEPPQGSIRLSAAAPPLLRFTSCNNENKTSVFSRFPFFPGITKKKKQLVMQKHIEKRNTRRRRGEEEGGKTWRRRLLGGLGGFGGFLDVPVHV